MSKFFKNKDVGRNSGFMMIELIVAIFIFIIVMTVSMGALVTGLDSNRKAESLKSVLNNLSVVLDTMTKTLAVGSHYYCQEVSTLIDNQGLDCLIGDVSNNHRTMSFLFNADLGGNDIADDVIVYKYVPASGSQGGYIARTIYTNGGSGQIGPIRMTAPEVNITDMKFYVSGSAPLASGNTDQPKVLITISGKSPAGPRGGETNFSVQNLVTQRLPDF